MQLVQNFLILLSEMVLVHTIITLMNTQPMRLHLRTVAVPLLSITTHSHYRRPTDRTIVHVPRIGIDELLQALVMHHMITMAAQLHDPFVFNLWLLVGLAHLCAVTSIISVRGCSAHLIDVALRLLLVLLVGLSSKSRLLVNLGSTELAVKPVAANTAFLGVSINLVDVGGFQKTDDL